MRAHLRLLDASLARRPVWGRLVFALICAGSAFALEWALRPGLPSAPLLLLTAGVLVAARYGGRGAGWLATAVSALLAQAFLTGAPASLVFAAVGALATTLLARHPAREGLDAALLRSIGDAVLATDARGVVRFINPAAARLLGWTEAEAVGLPVGQVLHLLRMDTREPVLDPLAQVLGGALWTEHPRLLSARDGRELPIEENAAPIHDASGAVLGAVLVLRDASARRQLEQERADLLAREHAALREAQAHRERMESLIRQAPVAIAVFRGQDHVCEMLNPHAREVFDPDGTLVGRPLRDVLPDMDPALLGLLDDVYRTGVPFSGREVPMALKPLSGAKAPGVLGRYFDLSWQPWREADGTLQGVVAVAVEVTGLVSARRAAEALAQELREALHTRDEFLSIASHELKTPITSIQLQLQMLLRTVPQDTAPATSALVRQRVEAVLRPISRLHQLVVTLLDVSRIRAGRLQLQQEPVDLTALTQELVARAQEDAANARCPLLIDADAGPLVGSWDRIRLEQVITNLLSNAFKYGAQRPVEVRVTREGGFARLSVTDHGIGIAPEDHERIFQRFERAVSERHYGGFGLGLWIVRQIVESLNGDIHVKSQPGTGATFVVRLPLASAAAAVA